MRITMMLTFVLFVNVFLFLGQTSIDKINPGDAQSDFFNYENSWLQAKDGGNYTLIQKADLPTSQSSVDVTDGNIFTDTWRTLSSWLQQNVPAVDYIGRVLNGPAHFLQAANIPAEISFALGWLWHILGLFLFITWIRGGSS